MGDPGWTTAEAYEDGRQNRLALVPKDIHIYEMVEAARQWKAARFQHEHTSYYGANHVRCQWAYWLGRIRSERERLGVRGRFDARRR